MNPFQLVVEMKKLLVHTLAWIDRAEAHAAAKGYDASNLLEARLAPDMFTLAQQVQEACHAANDAISRLTGRGAAARETPETSFAGFKGQIARTIESVRATPASAFDGAEDRDCSIEISGNLVIAMNGLQLLRSWSLPHFYFHVVTAYDILRHNGVQIGKKDYVSQVGAFIRPSA